MRDQEIVGLYEAYQSIYSNVGEEVSEVEQLDEDLAGAVDTFLKKGGELVKKKAPGVAAALTAGGGRKTPTATSGGYRPVTKEEVEAWVNALVEEGYDLSEYTWEDMCEMYNANKEVGQLDEFMKHQKEREGIESRRKMRSYSPPTKGKHGEIERRRAKKPPSRLRSGSLPVSNQAEEVDADLFDTILEYLVAEGYADTNEAAITIMANMSEEWRKEIVEEVLDEAEGSYGQTPKARTAYGALANRRRATPAGGFAKRGEKTTKVKSAQKHFDRTGNPDAGNRGKKSTKSRYPGGREGMTQKDRDYARGRDEYGHTGYDPDYDGQASGPGGKPKGKKAERQRKTGVSAD